MAASLPRRQSYLKSKAYTPCPNLFALCPLMVENDPSGSQNKKGTHKSPGSITSRFRQTAGVNISPQNIGAEEKNRRGGYNDEKTFSKIRILF